jgi:hypothetical protein
MREFRIVIAAATLAAVVHAVPANATAYSSDQSDLWWIPASPAGASSSSSAGR